MEAIVSGALRDLVARLRDTIGASLGRVVLFGSQARGDATPSSDVDVAVIVCGQATDVWDAVTAVAADVSLEHDVTVIPLVLSVEDWRRMQSERAPLARNIEAEGMALWFARQEATLSPTM